MDRYTFECRVKKITYFRLHFMHVEFLSYTLPDYEG